MIKALLRKIRERLFYGLARQADIDALYEQVAGLLQISSAMKGEPVLKSLRGWAISPDAMSILLGRLQEFNEPTVVEFGSGQSTVIFAAVLRHRQGQLISIEHDSNYSAKIQQQIQACGLSSYVKFVHAPLQPTLDLQTTRSYDLSSLPVVAPDLVLVDGPPFTEGETTRIGPLRWGIAHLKPGGSVFLDDSNRRYEKRCVELLLTEFPSLRLIDHPAEKGLREIQLGDFGER